MSSCTLPIRPCLRAATTSTTTSSSTFLLSIRSLSTTPSRKYNQYAVPHSRLPVPNVSGRIPNIPDEAQAKIQIPAYPYGPRQTYKQSNKGLYGTATIRFGNKVSERNEIKTRRKWRPNVHEKRLWSRSLGIYVRTRVTTRVLRTIDKSGGLDEYLLGTKPARVKELGPWGWILRWRIMQTPSVIARFAAERRKLGLPIQPRVSYEKMLKTYGVRKAPLLIHKSKLAPVTDKEVIEETDRALRDNMEFDLSGGYGTAAQILDSVDAAAVGQAQTEVTEAMEEAEVEQPVEAREEAEQKEEKK